MGGGPLRDELMEHFGCTPALVSVSAFVQQRDKILPEAIEFLFQEFTRQSQKQKLYKGYRLLAADGSDLLFSANPNDKLSYFPGVNGQKHYNLLHMNALYDLQTKTYTDVVIQKKKALNENAALVQMIQRAPSDSPTLVIADRAYEAYNTIAHLERKGWNYLIRMREKSGILSPFNLPEEGDMDTDAELILTRKYNKHIKHLMQQHPGRYRHIARTTPLDDLDETGTFYPMRFRIVRFQITEGTYETVMTNLDRKKFPPEELKLLYNKRWGIETSFRKLKHTVGLKQLQSKKVEHVIQEVFARFIMYNLTELIASHAVRRKKKKDMFQINFSAAVHICRRLLRGSVPPPRAEAMISKYITPIRPGRSAPRKLKPNSFKGFLYRIA